MLKCIFEPESVDQIESVESTAWNIRNKSQMYELVDELCNVHNALCDTCEIASDCFGIQMLTIVGTGFLCILINGFFAFLDIYIEKELQEIGKMRSLYGFVESVFLAAGMILACNSCYGVSEQVLA